MSVSSFVSQLDAIVRDKPIVAISCDIFDTLIFRRSGTTEQLWHELAKHAYQLGILCNDDADAFVEYRKEAEAIARRDMMQRKGHREVRIDDIYACWQSEKGDQLSRLEQKIEFDNWQLNPVLVDWLTNQQIKGIRVVLLSDMYLPSSLLQKFLRSKAPHLLIDKIYVSGEYQASKQDGRLYQRFLAEHDWLPATILHIGDDKITDLQMAEASGLVCCHLGLGDDYLAQFKYEQRLYRYSIPGLEGLRRQWRWYSDGSTISTLASQVYAPVLYAFSCWVVARCQQAGVRTLFCLLREGDAIARIIRQIPGHDLVVKTLAVSRRSTFLPSRDWSIELLHQLSQRRGYTLFELLEDLGLECPIGWHRYQTSTLTDLIPTTLWSEILIWIESERRSIEAHLQQQRHLLQQYLVQEGVINSPEVAILDWGCGGSLLHNLYLLAGLEQAHFFMFYASMRANRVALTQRLQVFQPAASRAWAQILASYPEVSEILLNGSLSSTRGYKQSIDRRITPISVSRSHEAIRDLGRQEKFIQVLLSWAKLAAKNGWLSVEPSLSDRRCAVSILYRFICYPMWSEACELADLPLPMAPGTSRTLLEKEKIPTLCACASDVLQAYQLLLDGVDPLLKNIAWYPGLVALAFPDQLQQCGELAIAQDDEKVAPLLLHKLQQSGIKEVAIYGAGELGLKVYEYLTRHGISISYVVDQRAEFSSFYLCDHLVISLDAAIGRGVDSYVIASRAFRHEIIDRIKNRYSSSNISLFSI